MEINRSELPEVRYEITDSGCMIRTEIAFGRDAYWRARDRAKRDYQRLCVLTPGEFYLNEYLVFKNGSVQSQQGGGN